MVKFAKIVDIKFIEGVKNTFCLIKVFCMGKKEKLQERLVHFAKKHLGRPYKYGAKVWEAPRIFDCSTFVQYLFKRVGIDLPRTALQQAHYGKKVSLKQLEPGDLIFVRRQWGHYNPEFPQGIGHVAMYVGDGRVIHASSRYTTKWKAKKGRVGGSVREESLEDYIKGDKVVVVKRIL